MSLSDHFTTRDAPLTDPTPRQWTAWLVARSLRWALALATLASLLIVGPMGAVVVVRLARRGVGGLVLGAAVAAALVVAGAAALSLGIGQLVAADADKPEGES